MTKCTVRLSRTYQSKLNAILGENLPEGTIPGFKRAVGGKIEIDTDLLSEQDISSNDKVIDALATIMASTKSNLFITKETKVDGKTVLSSAIDVLEYDKNKESIKEWMLQNLGTSDLTSLSFASRYRTAMNQIVKEIETLEKDKAANRAKIESAIVRLKSITNDYKKTASDRVKGSEAYSKVLNETTARLNKYDVEYSTEYTPTTFNIPAYAQIHYDSYLPVNDNLFLINFQQEKSDVIGDVNPDIISITNDLFNTLLATKTPFRYTTRYKDTNGIGFNFWEVDENGKHTRVRIAKADGTEVEYLFNSKDATKVYVQDGTKYSKGADRIPLSINQFLTNKDLQKYNETNTERSFELAGANEDLSNTVFEVSQTIAVQSNRRLMDWLAIYNNNVEDGKRINPDLIFAQGRIEMLGQEVTMVKKDENDNWVIIQEQFDSFVTLGLSKNHDSIVKQPSEEGKMLFEVSGQNWNIVRKGGVVEQVHLDHFFTGDILDQGKFMEFVTKYFSIAYDMNNEELKQIYKELIKDHEITDKRNKDEGKNDSSLLSRLVEAEKIRSGDNANFIEIEGIKVPTFIPYKILQEFLTPEGYHTNREAHTKAKLFFELINKVAYNFFEAKTAAKLLSEDSINNKPVQIPFPEFQEKVKALVSLNGDEEAHTASNLEPHIKTGNKRPLSGSKLGVISFTIYREKTTGKIVKDFSTYSELEENNEYESEEYTTRFYYKSTKGSDNEIRIGEILDSNNNPVSFTAKEIDELVNTYAFKGLAKSIGLEIDAKIKNEFEITNNLISQELLGISGWKNRKPGNLIIPYGKYLIPVNVSAKEIKNEVEVPKRIIEELEKLNIKAFENKKVHFKALAPFMFIFHLYPEFFTVMGRPMNIPGFDIIGNMFGQGYEIELNGTRVPIWQYIHEVLKPLRLETADATTHFKEILTKRLEENPLLNTPDYFQEWLSRYVVVDPNIDLTGLGKFHDETWKDLDIDGKIARNEAVPDIEIVTEFTSRVLDALDTSGINIGNIYKVAEDGTSKLVEGNDFVTAFTSDFASNVAQQTITSAFGTLKSIASDKNKVKGAKKKDGTRSGSRLPSDYFKSYWGSQAIVLLNTMKFLRTLIKKDSNKKYQEYLDQIDTYLNHSTQQEKVDQWDSIIELLDGTQLNIDGVSNSLRDHVQESQKNLLGKKLSGILSQNTLDDLWEYDHKILNLVVKGKANTTGGFQTDTSISVPLRIETHNGKFYIAGYLPFVSYQDNNFVYERVTGTSYRSKFMIPIEKFTNSKGEFSESEINIDKLRKAIIEDIVRRKKERAKTVLKNSDTSNQNKAFFEAVQKNDGKDFEKFIGGIFDSMQVYEQVPSVLRDQPISAKTQVTNLNEAQPFKFYVNKNGAINIFKPIGLNRDAEKVTKADEVTEVVSTIKKQYEETDWYIQDQNEQFKNDYSISDQEIIDYLQITTKGQTKLTPFEIEAVQNLINRSRLNGTPLGVSYKNLVALKTNSAGIFYHEVFHQVFGGLLFQYEREDILNILGKKVLITDEMLEEFTEQRGFQGKPKEFIKSKFLEEKLADMFAQYKLDQRKEKDSFWRRMLGNKIVDLFETILKFIGLTKNNKLIRFFDKIDGGYYAERDLLSREKPDFNIIEFSSDKKTVFTLHTPSILKNRLLKFFYDNKRKVNESTEEFLGKFAEEVLETTTNRIDNIAKSIKSFENFSSTDLRILQDQLLLPLFIGKVSQKYMKSLDSLYWVFKAIDEVEKSNVVKTHFKKLFITVNRFYGDGGVNLKTLNNTSSDNLSLVYEELRKQGLPEYGGEIDENGNPIPVEEDPDIMENDDTGGSSFNKNGLNVDPSMRLAKYIKHLIGDYSIERSIEVNPNGEVIKIPIDLDSLTVYNSLIKLYVGKSLNTGNFENDTEVFLSTLDFYAEMHFKASDKSIYQGVKEFRDFVYSHFEINKNTPKEPKIEGDKTYTEYRTKAGKVNPKQLASEIRSEKKQDMRRFLFAFSNNIVDYQVGNVKSLAASGSGMLNYTFTPSLKYEIVKDKLAFTKSRRKVTIEEEKNTKIAVDAIDTINKKLSKNPTEDALYNAAKEIKEKLDSLKIYFSMEFIVYSLSHPNRKNKSSIFKFFNSRFEPLSFTKEYINAILVASAQKDEEQSVESLQEKDENAKKEKENNKNQPETVVERVSIADVYDAVYASAYFDSQMSTLMIKDSNRNNRYVIVKDSLISRTLQNEPLIYADAILTNIDKKKSKADISKATKEQYTKFLVAAIWANSESFYSMGQLETTNTKIFVKGGRHDYATVVDGVVSVNREGVGAISNIIQEELTLLSKFINLANKGAITEEINGYTTVYRDSKGNLDLERTLSSNRLTKLFETETLLGKKDYKEFVKIVHDAIKSQIKDGDVSLTLNELLPDYSDKIKSYVNSLYEVESKKFEKWGILLPSTYPYEKNQKHFVMNTLLNTMTNRRDMLVKMYGNLGAAFKDMTSDFTKRGKVAAAIGASISSYKMQEITDTYTYMALYDSNITEKKKFQVTSNDFNTFKSELVKVLEERGMTDKVIGSIMDAKDEREISKAVKGIANLRIRRAESTDGDSEVSVVHRIQELNDLVRVDDQIKKLSLYVLSEGFLWMDDKGTIVRYNHELHNKDYLKASDYSMKTNANFGKFKTVATFRDLNESLGIETLKYIKQSEIVLSGELVRIRKELSVKDAAKMTALYTELFNKVFNDKLSDQERFMNAGTIYKQLEKYYEPKTGMKSVYDRFIHMTRNDIGHNVFRTASKTAISTVVDNNGNKSGKIITVPAGYKFLQQEVPNVKMEAYSGTQFISLIQSDQDDKLVVYLDGKKITIGDVKKEFQSNLAKMFNIEESLVLEALELYKTSGGYSSTEINYEALYKSIRKSMEASAKDDMSIHRFTTDESGNPKFEIPPNMFYEMQNMMTSILNKPYKLKKNAESYALASSEYYTVLEDENGMIVPSHKEEIGKVYKTRKLQVQYETRIEVDEDGNEYEQEYEVHECVVGSTREYEHLLLNQELTAEQLYAILPLNSPLREMLGYRIPTENKRSIKIFKIVDFLPAHYGSTMVTTTQSMLEDGHDFDIDKQYTEKPYEMRVPEYETEVEINGEIQSVNLLKILIGEYYQIGYKYTLNDFKNNIDILEQINGGVNKINILLDKNAEEILFKREVAKRISTNRKDINNIFDSLSEIASDLEESRNDFREDYNGLVEDLKEELENGLTKKELINYIGRKGFAEVKDDIKPYIVDGKYIFVPKTNSEDLIFESILKLSLANDDVLQESLTDIKNLSAEQKRLNDLRIYYSKESARVKTFVKNDKIHMFPFYANKQITLAKTLLSNDHTRFVNYKQTEETDLTFLEAKRDMQIKVLEKLQQNVEFYYGSLSAQTEVFSSTTVGSMNIAITASTNKQYAELNTSGTELSYTLELRVKEKNEDKEKNIFYDFKKFADMENKKYIALTTMALEKEKGYLLGLGIDEKEVNDYIEIMTEQLLTRKTTNSTFLGMQVTASTDQVKNNLNIPLNMTEDVISVDGLLIELGIPYPIRSGIMTHPVIRFLGELKDDGFSNKEMLNKVASTYGLEEKDIQKINKDNDKRRLEGRKGGNLVNENTNLFVPSVEDIFDSVTINEKGEIIIDKVAAYNLTKFFLSVKDISLSMIPLNKLTGMTKGISNNLEDFPDYVRVARWLDLRASDVLINSKNDEKYAEFVKGLFDHISARKPPITYLENALENDLVKKQITSFFDYFLYIMYKSTPLKDKFVQEGLFKFVESGLPWTKEVLQHFLGVNYATKEEIKLSQAPSILMTYRKDDVPKTERMDTIFYLRRIDKILEAYMSQSKSLFASKLTSGTGNGKFFPKIPNMNGFMKLNTESIQYLAKELLDESLDPVQKITFNCKLDDGTEVAASISVKDVVSLLFLVDKLYNGGIRSNTSIGTYEPLTLSKYDETIQFDVLIPHIFDQQMITAVEKLTPWQRSELKAIPKRGRIIKFLDGNLFTLKFNISSVSQGHYSNELLNEDTGEYIDEIIEESDTNPYFGYYEVKGRRDEYIKSSEIETMLMFDGKTYPVVITSYSSLNKKNIKGSSQSTRYMTPQTIAELYTGEVKTYTSEEIKVTKRKNSFTSTIDHSVGEVLIYDDKTYVITAVKQTKIKDSKESTTRYSIVPIRNSEGVTMEELLKDKKELEIATRKELQALVDTYELVSGYDKLQREGASEEELKIKLEEEGEKFKQPYMTQKQLEEGQELSSLSLGSLVELSETNKIIESLNLLEKENVSEIVKNFIEYQLGVKSCKI